jgi:hypothetical protein
MPQMDIKRDIRTWKNSIYFSTCPPPTVIHLFHHFTSASTAKRLPPSCEPLYATNTSHRKQETFLYKPLCSEFLPTEKRTTEDCSSVLYVSSTVAILTMKTSLNICMHLCYLDCHEAGLCCYLVIHVKNLLRPLLLFYFHLLPSASPL